MAYTFRYAGMPRSEYAHKLRVKGYTQEEIAANMGCGRVNAMRMLEVYERIQAKKKESNIFKYMYEQCLEEGIATKIQRELNKSGIKTMKGLIAYLDEGHKITDIKGINETLAYTIDQTLREYEIRKRK